jgi:hypothetical protein
MAYDLMMLTREPLTRAGAEKLYAEATQAFGATISDPVLTWDDAWSADPEMAVDELLDGIDGEDIDPDEYRAFCRKYGLPDDIDTPSPEAAARFLGSQHGFPLMTFTLPVDEDAARKAYLSAVELARAHQLVLHDPTTAEDIDLAKPGELPRHYR